MEMLRRFDGSSQRVARNRKPSSDFSEMLEFRSTSTPLIFQPSSSEISKSRGEHNTRTIFDFNIQWSVILTQKLRGIPLIVPAIKIYFAPKESASAGKKNSSEGDLSRFSVA